MIRIDEMELEAFVYFVHFIYMIFESIFYIVSMTQRYLQVLVNKMQHHRHTYKKQFSSDFRTE